MGNSDGGESRVQTCNVLDITKFAWTNFYTWHKALRPAPLRSEADAGKPVCHEEGGGNDETLHDNRKCVSFILHQWSRLRPACTLRVVAVFFFRDYRALGK